MESSEENVACEGGYLLPLHLSLDLHGWRSTISRRHLFFLLVLVTSYYHHQWRLIQKTVAIDAVAFR